MYSTIVMAFLAMIAGIGVSCGVFAFVLVIGVIPRVISKTGIKNISPHNIIAHIYQNGMVKPEIKRRVLSNILTYSVPCAVSRGFSPLKT